MPVVEEIKDWLVAQGVGTFGSNIILGSKATIPTGDGPYLSIIETGGSGAVRTHNGVPVERASLQLLARARLNPAARTMLKAAYDALGGAKGLHNVTLGSTFYLNITPRQNITDIGLDSSGRIMFSYNLDVDKAPS